MSEDILKHFLAVGGSADDLDELPVSDYGSKDSLDAMPVKNKNFYGQPAPTQN